MNENIKMIKKNTICVSNDIIKLGNCQVVLRYIVIALGKVQYSSYI